MTTLADRPTIDSQLDDDRIVAALQEQRATLLDVIRNATEAKARAVQDIDDAKARLVRVERLLRAANPAPRKPRAAKETGKKEVAK